MISLYLFGGGNEPEVPVCFIGLKANRVLPVFQSGEDVNRTRRHHNDLDAKAAQAINLIE